MKLVYSLLSASLPESRQTLQGYPRLVWHHPSLLREICKSDKFTENINESQQYQKRKNYYPIKQQSWSEQEIFKIDIVPFSGCRQRN